MPHAPRSAPRPARPAALAALIALVAAGLTACALPGTGASPGSGPGMAGGPAAEASRTAPPDASRPRVFVNREGRVLVDQEPIYVSARDPKPITFSLLGSNLAFTGGGIEIEGEVVGVDPPGALSGEGPKPPGWSVKLDRNQTAIRCQGEGRQMVVCRFGNVRPGQVFHYTIRVERDGRPLPPLDPVIRIM